jgi:hypothetical protein
MQRLLAISLLSVMTAACGTNGPGADDDGSPYGEGFGTPENPVPQSAEEGPYATKTMMDFTAEQLLPPTVEDVVQVLRAFGDNPARGLIKAADKGGLVVLEELYGALPSTLQDKFEGWVNGELDKVKINGKTLSQYAAQAAMMAEFALTKFELDSELSITPEGATHTLTAVDFTPVGINFRIPISGIASDVLTQHPTVMVGLGGELVLGDESFGLRIGEYAWGGFNAGVADLFGGDLQASLESGINCTAVAQSVADKCLPFTSICVGHESMIKGVCTGARDLFVEQLHALFARLNLDAFHMARGDAKLVDDNGNGIADRIVDGLWDSEMNIGLGLRKAPATFEASRMDAPPVTQ